jgi:uncharacterized protein
VAETTGKSEEEVRQALERSLVKLYQERAKRIRPGLDNKILTSWNGLMISALSIAYQALGDGEMLDAARKAADFLLETLYDPAEKAVLRRYCEGEACIPAFLDDHAFLALGLLDLYEASLEPRYLRVAADVCGAMADRFWDDEGGGFFFTPAGGEVGGMGRRKDDYDGAEPSGNSVAATVLLRLAEMTGNAEWRERGERTVTAVSGALANYPETMPAMLSALDIMLAAPRQVVVAGDPGAADTRALIRTVQEPYRPNTLLMQATSDEAIAELAPWLLEMRPLDGRAAAYVCEDFACQAPTTDLEAVRDIVKARPSAG